MAVWTPSLSIPGTRCTLTPTAHAALSVQGFAREASSVGAPCLGCGLACGSSSLYLQDPAADSPAARWRFQMPGRAGATPGSTLCPIRLSLS